MIGLPVIGYAKWHKSQGQVAVIDNENYDDDINSAYSPISDQLESNRWSALPIANVFCGILNIAEGILVSEPRKSKHAISYVIEDNFTKYRVILILTGIAELTLVGGWILHGGATIYYYATRHDEYVSV